MPVSLQILNLEDNPLDTELTVAELSKEWPDIKVVRVEKRDEFLSALENNHFDLILADYNLPDFDGLSALEIIKKDYPDLPFIFVTGAMGEESAIETLKKGATDFVLKNRLFRLVSAIRRAMTEARELKIRRQTEEELKKSEVRYRKLVESLTDYIFSVEIKKGAPSKTVHGPGCEGVTGYTPEEYQTNPSLWFDMVYKEDKEAVKRQATNILKGKAETLEHRIIQKNGKMIWVKNVIVPRFSEKGELISYDGLISNITRQKEYEQKILQEMDITSHLLMIAEATSQITDIQQLLNKVVSCTYEITKCNFCLSYVYEKETASFRPSESHGLSHELTSRFMIESLKGNAANIQECLKQGSPVIFSAKEISRGMFAGFSYLGKIQTLVVIALIARNEPLGLLLTFFNEEKIFSERERKIMQGISHQTSLALDQARLYRDSLERSIELSSRIETIQVMHEIDKSILSTLDSHEILESVTNLVSRLIPCDRATVAVVNKEKGGFVYTAGFGITFMKKGDFVPFSETSATELVSSGKLDYTANLSRVVDRNKFENKLFNDGYLSHIRVPLYIKGEITALLNIGSKRPSAFSVDNLSTLEKLSSQVSVALQNASLLTDLQELFLGTVKSLSSAIDAKSHWTSGHSANVTSYALKIGEVLGFSSEDLKKLELGALLHDIGKLGTYESILDKPGKLTEEEFNLIKQHPNKGAEILSPIAQLKDVIPAIRHHHEYYNGTGYPDGLKEEEIPLMARILCVADSADAMSSDRPYRKGMPREEIIKELTDLSGIQFDPQIAKIYIQLYSEA